MSVSLPNSHEYTINDSVINTVDHYKDLGIIITSYTLHYELRLIKCWNYCAELLHSIIAKKKLYLKFNWISTHLLFPSVATFSYTYRFIERIQRSATKYILNDYNISYKSR